MPILNYTTKIDSYKTVTEIQQLLSKNGANKIIVDNDPNGNPIAITFCLNWNGPVAFSLPCRFDGVLKSMKKDSKVPRAMKTEEQALRVGWRIIKDWIEAQLAIVKAELASMPEIFLPYAITKKGGTVWEQIQTDSSILLIS